MENDAKKASTPGNTQNTPPVPSELIKPSEAVEPVDINQAEAEAEANTDTVQDAPQSERSTEVQSTDQDSQFSSEEGKPDPTTEEQTAQSNDTSDSNPKPESMTQTESAPQPGPKTAALPKLKSQTQKTLASARKLLLDKERLPLVGAAAALLLCLVFAISSCSSQQAGLAQTQEELARAQEEIDGLRSRISELHLENMELESKNEEYVAIIAEYENGAAAQLIDIKNAFEAGQWEKTIELYNSLHQKYNGSPEDAEAKAIADQAQTKIDEAKAAEEQRKKEEEARKAEEEARRKEEEARAYDTGITFDQIARNPDEYSGQKVKFTGKVIQVIRDTETTTIRLAIDSDYDKVILGSYLNDITSSRVLEDDIITIKGMFLGETTYTSTLGASISVPDVFIQEIEQ